VGWGKAGEGPGCGRGAERGFGSCAATAKKVSGRMGGDAGGLGAVVGR